MTPGGLCAAAAALRAGEVRATELLAQAVAAAEAATALNAFAWLDADGARGQAARCDAAAARGEWRGPLHGIPVTVKELFAVAGVTVRAGSRAPLPPLAPGPGGDAAAVARLRAAGAVLLGTTNMVEVALGITGENPHTGDVHNPHDPARQPGGSSSGAAVAVAVGAGLAGLGTDTGGSVRIPAALCGVVGVKPSRGRVPLDGALPLSPTCDHAGPLAGSVADAAVVLSVLTAGAVGAAGADPRRVDRPRLGVPRRYLEGALAPGVRAAFEAWLGAAADRGASVVDADPADLDQAPAAYTPLVRAEAAWVHRAALAADPGVFGAAVRGPLLAGREISAVDYLDRRAARARVRAGLAAALRGVDALVLPATPVPAPLLGATTVELESGPAPHRDAFLRLTVPFSLAGVPVVAVPAGRVDGLPVGVQVVTAYGDDDRALDLAAWLTPPSPHPS